MPLLPGLHWRRLALLLGLAICLVTGCVTPEDGGGPASKGSARDRCSNLDGDAHLDGDRRPDHAFFTAEEGTSIVAVCLGNGVVDTVSVDDFEGTVFYFVDLNGDGREEIVYGGTSGCGSGGAVATVVGTRIRRAKRPDGSDLDVSEGCAGEGGTASYWCSADQLIEILVEPHGGESVWTREVVAVRGDRARVVERATGSAPLVTDGYVPAIPDDALPSPLSARPCATHA